MSTKEKKPKPKKIKPLSKEEHGELFSKVDSEGFGYYMLHYGPDLEAIERLGFDRAKVEEAIEVLSEVEMAIGEGEQYTEELD